mgnify:CR=1 FL=1
MKILAIGAHPDDLEIFCFGTLMAWRAMGADLALAIATDGAAGGDLPPDDLGADAVIDGYDELISALIRLGDTPSATSSTNAAPA